VKYFIDFFFFMPLCPPPLLFKSFPPSLHRAIPSLLPHVNRALGFQTDVLVQPPSGLTVFIVLAPIKVVIPLLLLERLFFFSVHVFPLFDD